MFLIYLEKYKHEFFFTNIFVPGRFYIHSRGSRNRFISLKSEKKSFDIFSSWKKEPSRTVWKLGNCISLRPFFVLLFVLNLKRKQMKRAGSCGKTGNETNEIGTLGTIKKNHKNENHFKKKSELKFGHSLPTVKI